MTSEDQPGDALGVISSVHPLLKHMGEERVAAAAANHNASPYVYVQFEAMCDPVFRALVDSGATHSCISRRAFELLAEAAGADAVLRWPRARAPVSVTLADGASARPLGAVVLSLGMRTVRDTVLWTDASFLILEGLSENIILGMDWEERMGVTRFLPARVLGLSTTAEARACYEEWAAEMLESGVMKDMPASVCTHLVPFVMGLGDGELHIGARPQQCREVPAEPGVTHTVRRVSTIEGAGPEERACESKRSTRFTLRSVRSFHIPPQTEMGPIPVSLSKGLPSGRPL